MNYEFFLAKRIISNKAYKSSVSAPIIKIGITAIAIGMIVMLIAVATGLGMQKKVREKIVAFNGHVTITNYDTNASEESQVPISINQDFYPEFKTVEGIRHIQAVAKKFGIIRTEETFEGIVFKGVGREYDWSGMQEFLVEGRVPEFGEKASNEVIVSKYLANRLQFKLGDTFQTVFAKKDVNALPNIRAFTIVGIYDSGFQEFDKTYVLGDLKHVQRLNKWDADQIGYFEVFLEDYNDLPQKGIEVYQNTPSTLNAVTVEQKFVAIFEWIKIFDNNTYGIIGIMIIVAGINMITALLVLILERTQMIGILKALGSTNWSIQKLFLYNAAYLIGLGLFWGNLIGLGLLFIQQQFGLLKFPNPEEYYVNIIPVYIGWEYILLLNLGTFLACLLMLVVPSMIISKVSPVKAIKFD